MPTTPSYTNQQKSDIGNRGGLIPMASDCVQNVGLVAGTPKVVTLPAGAEVVFFSGNTEFAMKLDEDLALAFPTGDVAAGSGAVLNPTSRWIPASLSITKITLISPSDGVLSLEWYR